MEDYGLSIDRQITYYLYQLGTPLGLVAAAYLLLFLVLLIWQDRFKWVALSLLIFLQTFGFIIRWGSGGVNVLSPPLEHLRSVARPGASCMLVLMLIPAFRSARGQRWRLIHPATLAFFAFELLLAWRFILGRSPEKGVLGMIVYAIGFLVLGVGLSRWLQGPRDAHAALKSVVCAGALLVLCSSYQYALNSTAAYHGTRLAGITNNPQHLGTTIAVCVPVAAYLLVRRGESMIWRVACAGFLGIALLVLVMSGSRLGALMTITGVLLLLRYRLGRIAVVAVSVTVVAFAGLQFFGSDAMSGADHLLSLENTRAQGWAATWDVFMHNFWFGTGNSDDLVESSYISAGSEAGVLGFIVVIIVTLLLLIGLLQVTRVRRHLAEHALLSDLVVAVIGAILVGSVFEAFLLSTLTDMLVIIYVFLGLMALMIDPGPPVGELPAEMAAGQEPGEFSSAENVGFSPGYMRAPHDPAYADSTYYN